MLLLAARNEERLLERVCWVRHAHAGSFPRAFGPALWSRFHSHS